MAYNQPNKNIAYHPLYSSIVDPLELNLSRSLFLYGRDFFNWWFVQMPILLLRYMNRVGKVLWDRLSIGMLLKTFFIPWHRDSKPVGYLVGISVRIIYLPIAFTIFAFATFSIALITLLWILLPILTILMLFFTPIFI